MASLSKPRPTQSRKVGAAARSLGGSRIQGALGMPLAEAIFELRWQLPTTATGAPGRDPGYDFMLGRFFDRVRSEYPELVNLPSSSEPVDRTAYVPRHQLRAAEGSWPMLQIGPGVLTANETRAYEWQDFGPRLDRAVTSLFDAYPESPGPLQPALLALRYVNTLRLDAENPNLVPFLREQLHTSLAVDPTLFDEPGEAENPVGLSFSMTFPMRKQTGFASVSMATGAEAGRPCLIWQLEGRALHPETPQQPEAIRAWLEHTHEHLIGWFRTLSRGELSASFVENV